MEAQNPVYVWADEFMVEEVFGNYFSNALNHIAGKRVIDVKLNRHDNLVRVSVFNTGEQIPEDSLPHIWDKFYKVDKARTREYGGSGIGLSIVRKIIEDHGGRIWATSKEGIGTEVHFVLRKYQEVVQE